ncbi:MAG: hypothetical protein M1283_03925 [Gammaproteobacteria bacterium]|nr:hypothetical protein [Gammaproteobacteria bacterium]
MKLFMPTQSLARNLLTATVLSLATTQVMAIVPVTPEPVLVRDVDRRTNEPVNGSCVTSTLTGPSASDFGYVCVLFVVPASKRLVVETVGYTLNATLRSPLKMVLFTGLPSGITNLFPLRETDPNTYTFYSLPSLGSFLTYSNTHATRFYLDENGTLLAGARVLGPLNTTTPTQQVFTFSGYLVDK